MPQLKLMPWFFNFILAWFFLFVVATIIINKNFPGTNYLTVTPPQKLSTSKKWLWT